MPEGSCAGGLQRQPGAAALGALPFPCLQRRTGPDGESSRGRGTAAPELLSDSLGSGCAYRISILAVPLGINYAFRTRGYSNVKIVYLQLGELKTEAEERTAPSTAAALVPPLSAAPRVRQGWIRPPLSWHFCPGEDPLLPALADHFPPVLWGGGSRLAGRGSVVVRIQPISPSTDFPP